MIHIVTAVLRDTTLSSRGILLLPFIVEAGLVSRFFIRIIRNVLLLAFQIIDDAFENNLFSFRKEYNTIHFTRSFTWSAKSLTHSLRLL